MELFVVAGYGVGCWGSVCYSSCILELGLSVLVGLCVRGDGIADGAPYSVNVILIMGDDVGVDSCRCVKLSRRDDVGLDGFMNGCRCRICGSEQQ